MLDGRVDAFARHFISGWAADTARPDACVDVVVLVDGQARGRTRADQPRQDLAELGTFGDGNHGFACRFDPPLSSLRAYEITVCHAGTEQPLRLGRFTMAAETSHAAERMRPLMVTTAGQPGLGRLMRSLAADPAIVAADSHDYNLRLTSYYAHALDVLVMASGQAPSRTDGLGDRDACLVGPNPYHAPDYEKVFAEPRLLYAFFQKHAAASICAAFKSILTDFYAALTVQQGRRATMYFAEQADLFGVASNFARLAFSDMREVVLLQDPRDAYCDARSQWAVSPAQAIERLRAVRDRALQLHGESRSDTSFLRIEDLRLRPEETLRLLSGFLMLDHVIAPHPDLVQGTEDAERESPATRGVGAWKTELDSEETALFAREFSEFLRVFGYETSASTHS